MAPRSPLAAPLLGASEGQLSGIGFTAAVLSLVKGCIGAGVMALPWATIQGGAASAPALILLGAWNGYTGWLLLDCDAPGSYSDLVRLALGRGGVVLLEGSLLVVLFGVCVSFQVQAATLLSSLPSLGRLASHDVYALITGAALLPLVLQRSFSGIAAISIAALAVLCLGLAAVGLWGLWAEGAPTLPPQLLEPPTAHGFADFLGVAAFSFGGQVFVLPVRDAMAMAAAAGRHRRRRVHGRHPGGVRGGGRGRRVPLLAGGREAARPAQHRARLLTGILGCLANMSALLLPPLIHLRLRGRRPASVARPAAVRTALAATDALLLLAGFASCAGPALLIVQQLARRAGEEGPEGLPPALGE